MHTIIDTELNYFNKDRYRVTQIGTQWIGKPKTYAWCAPSTSRFAESIEL